MKRIWGLTICVVFLVAAKAVAGWNGAGVPNGTAGTDISDTANWAGGVIDNDFRAITTDVTLEVVQDHVVTEAFFNFSTAAGVLTHIRLVGNKKLDLGTSMLIAPSNTASTVTFAKGLTLEYSGAGAHRYISGLGQVIIDAQIKGAVSVNRSSAHGNPVVYFRNPANDFSGIVASSGSNWRMYFSSLANSGVPCALGSGNELSGQFAQYYTYNGTRDSISDRTYTTRRDAGPILRNDSAMGGLRMTGTFKSINDASKHKYWVGGISYGEGRIDGNLVNNLTKFEKNGSGIWRLTGNNTFLGQADGSYDVAVTGGKLIADYLNDIAGAGSNRVFAAGRSVYLNDGHLVFQGKAGAGNTTYQAMGVCALDQYGSNALTVDGNGGDATTVVFDGFSSSGSTSLMLFDMAGNATLKTSAALQPDSGSVRLVNGVVMSSDGTTSYMVFRDSAGQVGFPTQDDEQRIVLHTNRTIVTESNSATYAGAHMTLTGAVTRTEDLSFSTMVADARANPVTLDMGGKKFQDEVDSVGRGFVAYGAYPVTVANGSHGAQASSYLFNYGTGKLTWGLSGSKVYVVGGTGLTELSTQLSAYFYVVGGTVRLTADNNWTGGKHYIAGDGVLELGADLNGATYGDYTRNLGNDTTQSVQFPAGGGFSAHGRDRVVNLGGSGARVTWHFNYFVSDGKPFVLSSPYADATLIFENEIDLTYYPREFRVRNGSAAVDARLTGTIRSDYVGGSLVKSGDGVLELTGAQTYRGNVSVIGGGLRLGADDVYANGLNDLVLGNATLDAGEKRNLFASLELLEDSGIALGGGTTALSFGDSSDKLWTGTLAITGALGANTLRFGTDSQGLTETQLAAITYGDSRVRLDEQGYLVKIQQGTFISVR